MSNFSPSYDNKIQRKYSLKTLEQKVQNKTALQEEIGWPAEPKKPVLCIPTGLTSQLGGELFEKVFEGLLSMNVEILILGKGSQEYGELITKAADEHDHCIHIVKDEDTEKRKMYAAADMALFFADPSDAEELEHCLQYGTVPVSPKASALKNYNPVQESGESFIFDGETHWHCFAAIVRAVETHRFPFDWRTIQRHCMEKVKGE